MKELLHVFALMCSVELCAQSAPAQAVLANLVGGLENPLVNAPVFLPNGRGPGPEFTAQLFVVESNGSLSPAYPASTFWPAGRGGYDISDRYIEPVAVVIPNRAPFDEVMLVVRAWQGSAGSYEAAIFRGESAPFHLQLGGGMYPPSNLLGLQTFNIVPEPPPLALGGVGLAVIQMFRRRVTRLIQGASFTTSMLSSSFERAFLVDRKD